MDWLHPLAKCKIEKLNGDVPLSKEYLYNICMNIPVLCNGDVYMIHSANPFIPTGKDAHCKLLKYSLSSDSWSDYSIPCDKESHQSDKQLHALTTCRSKLVLINGADGSVWEFDAKESTFKPSPDISLPWNGSTEHIAAASSGDYLIVATRKEDESGVSINIFDGNTWMIREGPNCQVKKRLQVIIHNHFVLLAESFGRYDDITDIHQKPLKSLIDDESTLWQPNLENTPLKSSTRSVSNLTFLDKHLCATSMDMSGCTHLWCYVADHKRWLELGNNRKIPDEESFVSLSHSAMIVGLADHSMMVLCLQQMSMQYYSLKPGELSNMQCVHVICIKRNEILCGQLNAWCSYNSPIFRLAITCS